jgi:uroporphyrin-III C-methyltransferase
MDDLFKNLPAFLPGTVWLTGAGPGDPGLLTLLAVKALRQADVIVYDALVDEACLKLASADAALEYAGKRGGKPSTKQRDISLRLVELARSGKRVLRLKGGDPLVFGRGGEEALTLVDHGISFRIVPGITAGIGGLAYAGIPVTHRDINHTVTFLTGHDSSGIVPDRIDWEAVGRGSPVIVMYMAIKHMGEISRALIAAGRHPLEPLAIVCNAATSAQRVVETTLANAQAMIASQNIEPPAIIVLGEVVKLRSGLDWIGTLTAGRALVGDPLSHRELKDHA